ncbi:MAG: hypothetical protein ACOYMG_23000, partial [Candidatus Methylumidiphilus sp.]
VIIMLHLGISTAKGMFAMICFASAPNSLASKPGRGAGKASKTGNGSSHPLSTNNVCKHSRTASCVIAFIRSKQKVSSESVSRNATVNAFSEIDDRR